MLGKLCRRLESQPDRSDVIEGGRVIDVNCAEFHFVALVGVPDFCVRIRLIHITLCRHEEDDAIRDELVGTADSHGNSIDRLPVVTHKRDLRSMIIRLIHVLIPFLSARVPDIQDDSLAAGESNIDLRNYRDQSRVMGFTDVLAQVCAD